MSNEVSATGTLLERLFVALRGKPAVRAIIADYGVTADLADARSSGGVLELILVDGAVLSVREEGLVGVLVAAGLAASASEAEYPAHHPV